MKKKTILISTILVCFILGIIFINLFLFKEIELTEETKTTSSPETIYNNNEKVVEDKTIKNITFTNIECSFDGNNSLLSYTIANKSQETVTLGEYEIIVKDKKETILANLAPRLDIELKPEESFDTGISSSIDLSSAYEIELVLEN